MKAGHRRQPLQLFQARYGGHEDQLITARLLQASYALPDLRLGGRDVANDILRKGAGEAVIMAEVFLRGRKRPGPQREVIEDEQARLLLTASGRPSGKKPLGGPPSILPAFRWNP